MLSCVYLQLVGPTSCIFMLSTSHWSALSLYPHTVLCPPPVGRPLPRVSSCCSPPVGRPIPSILILSRVHHIWSALPRVSSCCPVSTIFGRPYLVYPLVICGGHALPGCYLLEVEFRLVIHSTVKWIIWLQFSVAMTCLIIATDEKFRDSQRRWIISFRE